VIAPGLEAALEAALRERGLDTVEGAFALAEGADLDKPHLGSRRRTRLEIDAGGRNRTLFLKRYGPESTGAFWRRRLKTGQRESLGRSEYLNVRAVREAAVPTMRELACGQVRRGGGWGRSYVLVTAVPGEALERCGEDLLEAMDVTARQRFTGALAALAAGLHGAGLVHRDLYASHVFCEAPETADRPPRLYLIDLARVFRPRFRRFRWFVKDLAQLRYSMPERWVAEHWEAFLGAYLDRRQVSAGRTRWDRAIRAKAASIARRQLRRQRRQQRWAGRRARR
jgi:hypothetical protein